MEPESESEDELPDDAFGFDELEDVERSVPLQANGYIFTYMIADSGEPSMGIFLVGGEVRHADSDEIVGRLTASLLARNHEAEEDAEDDSDCFGEDEYDDENEDTDARDVHDACSQASQEMHDCATLLFSSSGWLRQPLRNKVTAASKSGGWLYLEEVRLLQAHRGEDAGLDFVSGLFDFLRGRWTLATIFPAGSPPRGKAVDAVGKLARHFARVGFKQVAGHAPLSQYWYLEASAASVRLSKAEAARIDVISPKKLAPMEGLDRELHEACRGIDVDDLENERSSPNLEDLRLLVERGANPDRACALHVCAANIDVNSARELLELGASVNTQDRNHSTPLHVASSLCGKSGMLGIVSLLLSFGARLDATNQEGMTPLECARGARRQAMEFRKMKGVSKTGQGHLRQYDRCIMLLSTFVQQPERNTSVEPKFNF